MQQLLEDVNHQPFVSVMQSLVLSPLKMEHSTFDLAKIFEYPSSYALPYSPNGKVYDDVPFMVMMKHMAIRKRNIPGNAGISVGGLWASATDLAELAIAMQNALANNKNTYIPHEVAMLIVTESSTKTRGLGFFIANKYGDETEGGQYFMHGGFNQGYLALFIAGNPNRSSSDGVIIMINVSPDYNAKNVYEWGFIKDVEKYIADRGHWS